MHPLEFWKQVKDNGYAVPDGIEPRAVLPELLEMLASSDPIVRDQVGYNVLAHWLMRDQFDDETKRGLLPTLEAKLHLGLGESGTQTVFSRSFACLIFAVLVSLHNEKPYLKPDDMNHLLGLAVTYLGGEQDLRGYVSGQGWVHAVAHCADWLDEHANAEGIGSEDLKRILNALAHKTEVETLYLFDEEDRLGYAAARAIHRQMLSAEQVETWVTGLATRVNVSDEQKSNRTRRHNAKGFLRSVHFYLDELGGDATYSKAIRNGLSALAL
jgi:hypothetical protein